MANLLEPPGLDAQAASVYRAMLAHPGARPVELAERLSLTQQQVERALAELDRLRLVRSSDETPDRQRPLRPGVAIDVLMARQETLLREYAQQLALSRAAAAQLIAEAAGPDGRTAGAGVEVLVGIDEIRDRLAALSRDVTEELLTFAPDGAQTDDNMRASRPLNAALLARGVRLRTIYLTSMRSHPPTLAHAQWLADRGGQVQTVATLPTRMLLIDRRTAAPPCSPATARTPARARSSSPSRGSWRPWARCSKPSGPRASRWPRRSQDRSRGRPGARSVSCPHRSWPRCG